MQHFQNFKLKNYTSFKIGAEAQNVFFPETIEEFISLLNTRPDAIVLGGMSNVLVSSQGVEQDVILTKKLCNYTITNSAISAQAGAMGPLVSKAAAQAGLSGMEFMCGFPGTIGGIVAMNASAHKQSIAEIFRQAKVYDLENKTVKVFTPEDMKFDYRTSVILSGRFIILEADFELKPAPKEKILCAMQANKEFRQSKQPDLRRPNCGSVFKNPACGFAGLLLDEAGVKGLSHGGARVFENHANFIINENNATSEDVSQLMKKMYNKVKEKFGVELQPEVRYIGKPNEVEREIWQLWKEFSNK